MSAYLSDLHMRQDVAVRPASASPAKAFKAGLHRQQGDAVRPASASPAKAFKADLHLHTKHSKDSLAEPSAVVEAAARKGLSAIAVTDHDEIAGALEAAAYAAERHPSLQVIVGEEVSTDRGDLLVYFLKKRIAPGKLEKVLSAVKRQQAVCSSAHPYDRIRHGIRLENLPPNLLSGINCIEGFNARITVPPHNTRAQEFAAAHRKPMLAGSDAHHPSEVGAAYAEFEGIKKLGAKNILSAPRRLSGRLSSPLVHFYSRYAVLKKRLLLRRH